MQRMWFAVMAMTVAGGSLAQVVGPDSPRAPSDYPAQASTHFAWADVLRVEPVYAMVAVGRPVARCRGALGEKPLSRDVGAGKSTEDAALGQGSAASSVEQDAGATQDAPTAAAAVIECRHTVRAYEERLDGYDVEYRYRGEVYLSRLDYDPGERLRVRVSVSPAN